jgi:hypothetical protein
MNIPFDKTKLRKMGKKRLPPMTGMALMQGKIGHRVFKSRFISVSYAISDEKARRKSVEFKLWKKGGSHDQVSPEVSAIS